MSYFVDGKREPHHILWEDIIDPYPPINFDEPNIQRSGVERETGSTLYRNGDTIVLEGRAHSRSMGNYYTFSGRFSLDDYRRGVADLQQAGSGEIQGADCMMRLRRIDDKEASVEVTVTVHAADFQSPGCQPADACTETIQETRPLSALVLPE